MIRISLCMIVKNEEDVLARCLDSVKGLTDEIIIVDTGSSDGTKAAAYEYTDKVYDFEWIDDFSAARNYSFKMASMEYCMWLDADDVLTEKNRLSFLKMKESLDNSADVIMMKYNTDFDKNGNPTFYYYRERIIKKQNRNLWEGAVHEVITPFGNIIYDETAVNHKKIRPNAPGRNLLIYQNLIRNGKELNPREEFYYARELYYNGMYKEAVCIFSSFLDGKKGWAVNNTDACNILSRCYRALGDSDMEMDCLLLGMRYGAPNPEACCNIAGIFFSREKYDEAIFWYKLAAAIEVDDKNGGFFRTDFKEYIPYIQLAVCYSRLGDNELAEIYNEKAGKVKPGDEKVLYNRNYFNSLKNNKKSRVF